METLPSEALQVAELTRYQRLALQIIGGLKVPVSKKQEPLTWNEIIDMVKSIRIELKLD